MTCTSNYYRDLRLNALWDMRVDPKDVTKEDVDMFIEHVILKKQAADKERLI